LAAEERPEAAAGAAPAATATTEKSADHPSHARLAFRHTQQTIRGMPTTLGREGGVPPPRPKAGGSGEDREWSRPWGAEAVRGEARPLPRPAASRDAPQRRRQDHDDDDGLGHTTRGKEKKKGREGTHRVGRRGVGRGRRQFIIVGARRERRGRRVVRGRVHQRVHLVDCARPP
jgi:hypothetical protein